MLVSADHRGRLRPILSIASFFVLSNIANYSAFSQYGVTETEARAAYCVGVMNREIGTLQKAQHEAPTKSIEEPWHSLGQQLVDDDERVRKRYLLYLNSTRALPDLLTGSVDVRVTTRHGGDDRLPKRRGCVSFHHGKVHWSPDCMRGARAVPRPVQTLAPVVHTPTKRPAVSRPLTTTIHLSASTDRAGLPIGKYLRNAGSRR